MDIFNFQTVFSMPRADFGLPQDVGNSAKVADRATALRGSFDELDNFSVTIKSGYALLILIRDIVLSIATQLSSSGTLLMDSIVTLANNDTGPVKASFGQVNQAIISLNILLNGGLGMELNTLTSKLGPSMSNQFVDGFKGISKALQALSVALGDLQNGIAQAQLAAGNGPVTSSLVRKFVPAALVYNVLAALDGIGSGVPSVMYTIKTTLG
ncbi:uncharacterized protein LOC131207966 [Anopheles bellator]|uniref:uncharacterized protein LOC131207966 n=1 Tax=Anopheles bellator TaxID=139047 RepID=UPI0026498DB1|nr:uncharacterized protein LOC131207966 [Anopheles bellator]